MKKDFHFPANKDSFSQERFRTWSFGLRVRDSGNWKLLIEGHHATLTILMAIYAVRENT